MLALCACAAKTSWDRERRGTRSRQPSCSKVSRRARSRISSWIRRAYSSTSSAPCLPIFMVVRRSLYGIDGFTGTLLPAGLPLGFGAAVHVEPEFLHFLVVRAHREVETEQFER